MLKTVHFRQFRSLRDLRLRLDRFTVITGENGVGKSNVYRALAMLQRLAAGRFAEAIASEGGMPSLLWSGERKDKKPVRAAWKVEHNLFAYELECGLIPTTPDDPTAFRTDPDVKHETLHLHQRGKAYLVARRKGPMIDLRNAEARFDTSPLSLHMPESMLAEVRDAAAYPGLAAARATFLSWRFYHQFRTDPESPLRRPLIGSWSPVLSHDGANLASTLQTIKESGRGPQIDEAVQAAFPGTAWRAVDDEGRFQLQILRSGLKRWLNAAELSDGTLRFFCLCAALLSPHPPPLLVLNEPESSLHHSLYTGLVALFAQVPQETQILLVTHSTALAEVISNSVKTKSVPLINIDGATYGENGGPKIWAYEEDLEDTDQGFPLSGEP